MASPIRASSGSNSTTSTVNASASVTLFAANSNALARKIYNPAGNGILYIGYGSAAVSGATDASLAIAAGVVWDMPRQLGGVEYNGVIKGILASGTNVRVTEVT